MVGEMKGLSSAHDVEATPEGYIWLADAGNDRMLLLTPSLQIIKELSGSRYKFNGTLIVADMNRHTIKIIGTDGNLLQVIGTGWPETGPGRFATPEGMELRGETLWISDSGNDRIVKYCITRN